MELLLLLKLANDIALFWSVAGLFLKGEAHIGWASLGCCTLAYGFSLLIMFLRKKKTFLRFVPLAFCAGPFALGPGFFAGVFMLLPIIYTAVVIGNAWKGLDHYELSERILTSTMLGLVCTVFGRLFDREIEWAFMFLFFLVTAVLVMRLARMSRSGKLTARAWAENLGIMGVVFAAAMALGLPYVWKKIGQALLFIYLSVILPVLTFVLRCVSWLFFTFYNWILSLMGNFEDQKDPAEIMLPGVKIDQSLPDTKTFDHPWLKYVAIAIAVIAIFVIGWRFFKRLVGNGDTRTNEGVVEVREKLSAGETARPLKGNAGKVRKAYIRFLKALRHKGIRLGFWNTTGEIHRMAAGEIVPEKSEALRDIYLRARYDEACEVTAEDAVNAKTLVRELIS